MRALLASSPATRTYCNRRRHTRAHAMSTTTLSPAALIDELNAKYDVVHASFEKQFWATKMKLPNASTAELVKGKNALDAFLRDKTTLETVRAAAAAPGTTEAQKAVLAIFEKTFSLSSLDDPGAVALKEKLTAAEGDLEHARNNLALGYTVDGVTTPASSVLLRTTMKTHGDERVRKACYEGLRSIGDAVSPGLVEVVKMRNRLAKALGFADFYEMKVQQAEGFGKAELFSILDGLEERTRALMHGARAAVAAEKGAAALEPFNFGFAVSGDVTAAQDPYFPFEDAVDVWARSFAALGIKFRHATMTLDLCDREGKYSNGFCHWTQCAYVRGDGSWQPSTANFTSLAIPSAVGSGATALTTLMHEGGHAAHFANVTQRSPFFSQERAPTSVAYAETQSMTLDSLVGDAAWLGRYALDRSGVPMPWPLVEAGLRATRPPEVLALRAMLAVPYFEKALYEMREEEVTSRSIAELADAVEKRIQGGFSPRPLLSVPHILSDESSCYYHGYVLAEMAVHQNRAHFMKTFGRIVDEPRVGQALATTYWAPGNGAPYLDLVRGLTGTPLSGDAWVARLQAPLESVIASEKADYDAAVAAGPLLSPGSGADLDMRVVLAHGAEVIADSGPPGGGAQGLAAATRAFKAWVREKYFPETAAA